MRLSEARASKLYDAIYEPIMDLRLSYTKAKPLKADELDDELFRLQHNIWRAVHSALNLEGPA